MNNFVEQLIDDLKLVSIYKDAEGMAAYMKHKFVFFGVKTPQRREISKSFFKFYKPSSVTEIIQTANFLWNLSQREAHYIAIELLQFHQKKFTEDIITVYHQFIITNSWWDSVDAIGSCLLDHYFKSYPHQIDVITNNWNQSSNICLQRSSIMFQKQFKKATNTQILSSYILNCTSSKEFFVQKAIGWALREYGKTNPSWVTVFVNENYQNLAALSIREAAKRL